MRGDSTATTGNSFRSWVSRLFRGSRRPRPVLATPNGGGSGPIVFDASFRPDGSSANGRYPGGGPGSAPAGGRNGASDLSGREIQNLARQLLANDRYAFILLREAAEDIDESFTGPAWKAISAQMAVIPGGILPVVREDLTTELVEVQAFFLDRWAITNEQYFRFVQAGCYDDLENWPQDIWPSLMRFVDRTGKPGPADWENGKYPPGRADHPVTGVSWYEARAYAGWVGKRLPTAIEWQKAGGWPEQISGTGSITRYPWGELFSADRANLWCTGVGSTVSVREYRKGATPNGIFQMTGNTWEWMEDPLTAIPCDPTESLQTWKPMRRIAGGAFDTYLESEATNYFVTGQPELDRRSNIGFRCSLSADRLRPMPNLSNAR